MIFLSREFTQNRKTWQEVYEPKKIGNLCSRVWFVRNKRFPYPQLLFVVKLGRDRTNSIARLFILMTSWEWHSLFSISSFLTYNFYSFSTSSNASKSLKFLLPTLIFTILGSIMVNGYRTIEITSSCIRRAKIMKQLYKAKKNFITNKL